MPLFNCKLYNYNDSINNSCTNPSLSDNIDCSDENQIIENSINNIIMNGKDDIYSNITIYSMFIILY